MPFLEERGRRDGGEYRGQDRVAGRYLRHRQALRLPGTAGAAGHPAPRYAGDRPLRGGQPPDGGHRPGAGGRVPGRPKAQEHSHRSGRRAGAGRRGPPAGLVDAGALVLHRVRRGPGHAPGGAVLLPSGSLEAGPRRGPGGGLCGGGPVRARPAHRGVALRLGAGGGCGPNQGGVRDKRSQSRPQAVAGQGHSHLGNQRLPGGGGQERAGGLAGHPARGGHGPSHAKAPLRAPAVCRDRAAVRPRQRLG